MDSAIVNNVYELVVNRKILSKKRNIKFRFKYLFNQVDFSDKRVLDVGGGIGWITFFAAAKGAQKAVCLEPECAGSRNGMINKFNEFKSELQSALPVEHLPLTLQEHLQQIDGEAYDIVVLHNSINHLDEEACISLRQKESSYNTYKDIFTEVYNKMRPGGKLIVADCSRHNFYNAIGVKVSITRSIEWHKHQAPETWIGLLEEIGFKNPKLQWSTPDKFGQVGRVFMGNPLISYFSNSHFKFTMDR
jgi:SAM-dependent methyltransferase